MLGQRRRDWSQLPLELLQEIACHLIEISDHVRFRCVCVSWRSASKSINNFPRHLPWLLLPANNDGHFFSLTENRVYAPRLPASCFSPGTSKITPSSHGWIISPQPQRRGPLSVLNPVTRSVLTLPRPPMISNPRYIKLKLSGSGLVAAFFYSDFTYLRWPGKFFSLKKIKTPGFCPDNPDFSCCHGSFFVTNRVGTIVWSFDHVGTLQTSMEIPTPCRESSSNYLVETPSGDLLLVLMRSRYYKGKRFALFWLDSLHAKWIEVSDIGDNVLFVDDDQAIIFDATGYRRNCIYFLDRLVGSNEKEAELLFDIGQGQTEQVQVSPNVSLKCLEKVRWLVPSLGNFEGFYATIS